MGDWNIKARNRYIPKKLTIKMEGNDEWEILGRSYHSKLNVTNL